MNELTIDQLPELCLVRIFECFGLPDLVRCRAVCSLFKMYADRVKMKELFVSRNKYWPAKWYRTGRRIDCENRISWNAFSSLGPLQFKLRENLEFLYIDLHEQIVSFELLNELKQLVHLEVGWYKFFDHRKELTHPNLKVLSIPGIKCWPLVLKTPKLEVLQIDITGSVEFEYPETIKQLECKYVGASFMAKFKNLEVFRSSYPYPSSLLNQNVLSDWKQLKELDFEVYWHIYPRDQRETYNEFKRTLASILSEGAKRTPELKIYLSDVPILDTSMLEEYDFMKVSSNFVFKNWKLLRAPRNVCDVDYSQLINLVDELSMDFFEKFPRITHVSAAGEVDQQKFEWFLKNVSSLESLKLANTPLDQKFMDNLPDIANLLTDLEIIENQGIVTKFDFILRFAQIRRLKTTLPIEEPWSFSEKLFQKLENFCSFKFKLNSSNQWMETRKVGES